MFMKFCHLLQLYYEEMESEFGCITRFRSTYLPTGQTRHLRNNKKKKLKIKSLCAF